MKILKALVSIFIMLSSAVSLAADNGRAFLINGFAVFGTVALIQLKSVLREYRERLEACHMSHEQIEAELRAAQERLEKGGPCNG
jgi:hypothetical protein